MGSGAPSQVQQALAALKQMKSRIEEYERRANEPIAIIGYGCRFPGKANTPEEFWRVLREGVDTIDEIPGDRWEVERFYSDNPDEPNKTYARRGGFVDRVADFDPQFFGISPGEADRMDPQQRLVLEVAWESLESAGVQIDRLAGSNTGVFVGATHTDFYTLVRDAGLVDNYMGTGTNHSIIAGRLSYLLGLEGPALVVDTACSSSLVAIHLACQSLRAGECDLALAGGVNALLSAENFIAYSKARMLSKDGRCKTFDARADGYVRGEGCGMIVLKRLSLAVRDGDAILAVVRGTAINQDGHSSGLTAPSGPAQQAVIRAAHRVAGIEPSQIDYIEAHGTGTPLGDPIEVQALAAVLAEGRPADRPFVLGSVKTNIGHLESAAGIAGLIKIILSLQHEEIPPHLHLQQKNPHIAWEDVPAEIPTSVRPWKAGDRERLAGISSFGFSGTNSHVVIGEAPAAAAASATPPRRAYPIALSARSDKALDQLAGRYAAYLAAHPDTDLATFAWNVNTTRSHLPKRAAVVATDIGSAREKLAAMASGGRPSGSFRGAVGGKVAFLFTGQGSQYGGMGRDLYESEPVFRDCLDRCAKLLEHHLDTPLLPLMFGPDDPSGKLYQTEYAQPALFSLEIALIDLWRSWGVEPSYLAGHSLGEYGAAYTAGLVGLEEALLMVAKRGKMMQRDVVKGIGAAVFATEAEVRPKLADFRGEAVIAAVNAPRRLLVSGTVAGVHAAVDMLRAAGIEAKVLNGLGAAHSPVMEPILDEFEALGRTVPFERNPRIPIVSTLLGRLLEDGEMADPTYWRRQIREAVRFVDAMRALKDLGCDTFVEIGPRHTLVRLGQECLGENNGAAWLPTLSKERHDWQQALETLAEVYTRGGAHDWSGVASESRAGGRMRLPTYPFQHKRHWFKSEVVAARSSAGSSSRAGGFLGQRLRSASRDVQFEAVFGTADQPWLADHRMYGAILVPGAAHLARALTAGLTALGGRAVEIRSAVFRQPFVLATDDAVRTSQIVLSPRGDGSHGYQIVSAEGDAVEAEATWTLHSEGQVAVSRAEAPTLSATAPAEAGRRQLSSAQAYDELDGWGYNYGPSLRWIERASIGDGEAWVELRAPRADEPSQGLSIAPGLLDSVFQASVFVPAAGEELSAEAIYVPLAVDRLRLYGAAPAEPLVARVRLRRDKVAAGFRVADIDLMTRTGRAVAQVEGLRMRRAPREALLRELRERSTEWAHEVTWKRLPAPTATRAVEGTWLVVGGGAVGEHLAARLRDQGARVVTVRLDGAGASSGDAVALRGTGAAELDPVLRSAGGALQGVVFLGGVDAADRLRGADASPEVAGAAADLAGRALELAQAVIRHDEGRSAEAARPRLWLVTRGAQQVAAERDAAGLDDLGGVAQAALWGFGRTFANEHDELFGGLIDVDPSGPTGELADHIAAQLTAEDAAVAIRGDGRRYAPRLQRAAGVTARAALAPDATYLITGGSGMIGAAVARWMAQAGARNLVLMGRQGGGRADEVRRDLEANGCRVEVITGDIARAGDLDAALKRIGASMPPLRGVMHAAGVVDDAPIPRLSVDRLRTVFAAKVDGALNLYRALRGQPLDFVLLYSSISALYGFSGQAVYAGANAFLDGFAAYGRASGVPLTSVNWGPWSGGGMSANLTEQLHRTWGLAPLAPEDGTATLDHLIGHPRPQIAVIAPDWEQFGRRPHARALDQLVEKLTGGGAAGAEQAAEAAPAADDVVAQLRARPGQRQELLTRCVIDAVNVILGRDDGDDLSATGRFDGFGIDSLLSIDLVRYLQQVLKTSLPSTLVFEYPTVDALVAYLDQSLAPQPSPG